MDTIGITGKLIQKVTDSKGNKLTQRIVRVIRNGSFKSFTSQERARKIMCQGFFGIEEAIKHFGVSPSKRELTLLADVPFSEKTLITWQFTHILVAVFPLSILEIRSRVDRSLFSSTDFDIIKSQDVYHKNVVLNEQKFAKDHGKVGWHLVRKEHAPGSANWSWWLQRLFLGINNKVPGARVLIYTIVGYYLSTGARLFTNEYWDLSHNRCADRLSCGRSVAISNRGGGSAQGIICTSFSRFFSTWYLGVASERKR